MAEYGELKTSKRRSVYLETTIPGYLATGAMSDLVPAAHQQITQEWWKEARANFDLFISEAVLEEIRAGDQTFAAQRLELVNDLPVLALNDEVRDLVQVYNRRLGLPEDAVAGGIHIAFAIAYGLDYLVTWNCKHIANGRIIHRLAAIHRKVRRPNSVIVTPEQLF